MGFLNGNNYSYYMEMRRELEKAVQTKQIRAFKLDEPKMPGFFDSEVPSDRVYTGLVIEPLVGRSVVFPLPYIYSSAPVEGAVRAQEFIKRAYVDGPVPFIDANNRAALCFHVIKMALFHRPYVYVSTSEGKIGVVGDRNLWVGDFFTVPEIHSIPILWDEANRYAQDIEFILTGRSR